MVGVLAHYSRMQSAKKNCSFTGVPGVVYLTMNISMRMDVKRMLGIGSGLNRPSLQDSGSIPGETLKEIPYYLN